METQTENYNALPFAYNDYAISTNNQKQYDEELQPHEQLTEKQQKLFDIRLKMNEARKKNHKEVVEEDKRKCEPKNAEIKRKREEREEKERSKKQKTDPNQSKPLAQNNEEAEQEKEEEEEEKDDSYRGDPKLMNVTVEEAEEKAKKKGKKRPAPFGWDVFNQDSMYNSYKNRTKNIKVNLDRYEKQKQQLGDDFFADANNLKYGKIAPIDKEGVNEMVKELKENNAKKSAFSRRRAVHPDADVDYINERNRVFNKKISRSFDKYTSEIKQNLERGTAV